MIISLLSDDSCKVELAIPSNQSEIFILENSTLALTCTFIEYLPSCDSSQIRFYENSIELSSKHIKKLNDTSSTLILSNMKFIEENQDIYVRNYGCSYNHDSKNAQNSLSVIVGLNPVPLVDKCTSLDFRDLKCTFTKPHTRIPQNYSIQYVQESLRKINKNSTILKWKKDCNDNALDNSTIYCTFDFRSRLTLYISVAVSNGFNTTEYKKKFTVLELITFDTEMEIVNVSTKSAVLKHIPPYSIKMLYEDLELGFVYKIKYKPKDYPIDSWITLHKRRNNNTLLLLELQDLYPCTKYQILISARINPAQYDDNQYTKPAEITLNTICMHPETPPETNIGAFEICQNKVKIYWKDIPKYYKAENFSYEFRHVYEENQEILNKIPEFENNRANFEINHDKNYKFLIYSKNSLGESNTSTEIIVPKKSDRLREPTILKKFLAKKVYTLTWEFPFDEYPVSYTIFWCNPENEQFSVCENYIDFEVIDGIRTSFIYDNTNSSNSKNFAISANSNSSSSGMVWFQCTISHEQPKLNFIIKEQFINTNSIQMTWEEEICNSQSDGFSISYCEVDKIENFCISPVTFKNQSKDETIIIENLSAFTWYQINISMFNQLILGENFQKIIRTDEGIPEPPSNLSIISFTNTSILLNWDRSSIWNSFTGWHTVFYNNQNDTKGFTDNEILLSNLSAFTEYKIHVESCNNKGCSDFNNFIEVKTEVGVPGDIEKNLNDNNNNSIFFSWEPPSSPNGEIDFYEFRAVYSLNGVETERTVKLKTNYCTLKRKICSSEFQEGEFQFYVRAVNIKRLENDVTRTNEITSPVIPNINMDEIFECEEETQDFDEKLNFTYLSSINWTPLSKNSCKILITGNNTILYICIYLIVILLLTIIVIFFKRQLRKFRKQKDIVVILPEGLQDIFLDNNLTDKKMNDLPDIDKSKLENESKNFYGIENDDELIDENSKMILNVSVQNSPVISIKKLTLKNDSYESNSPISSLKKDHQIHPIVNGDITIICDEQVDKNGYTKVPVYPIMPMLRNGYILHSYFAKQMEDTNNKINRQENIDKTRIEIAI